jgi:hypothetical protein
MNSAGTAGMGGLYLPTADVKRIDSIQFGTAPGGLWALYLVKPINEIDLQPVPLSSATTTIFTEKCLCASESFDLPRIHDGAFLGFFYMPNGGGRAVSLLFGTATFIWG